ncbi:MAG: ArsR family transcriptional regulator [Candidatus Nanohaloarchaea archaeon]|nr:ArsR family transcriptional regulator [Candidatus Nanohaloarchaea archaeon]
MEQDELYQLLSFLKMSPYRQQIMQTLFDASEPKTPTELAESTGIHRDHISRHLAKLRQRGLVRVLNPDAPMHRFYILTEKGTKIMDRYQDRSEQL